MEPLSETAKRLTSNCAKRKHISQFIQLLLEVELTSSAPAFLPLT